MAVKFPLPDPKDPFSLKPSSISYTIQEEKALEIEQLTSLTAAIAGARAAATQFSKKAQSPQTYNIGDCITRSKSKAIEEDAEYLDKPVHGSGGTSGVEAAADTTVSKNKCTEMGEEGCSGSSSSRMEDDTKLTVNYKDESNKTSVATKRDDRNRSVGERRFDPGTARVRILFTLSAYYSNSLLCSSDLISHVDLSQIMAAAIRNLKPSS